VQGGFAAGSEVFRAWFWNRARSFVFSTAPSPVLCRVALQQLQHLREADGQRRQLRELEARLERELVRGGVPLRPGRRGPVFPIVLGAEDLTLAAAAALRERGVVSHAIRPPTVPAGGSRLRVTLRADMTLHEVEHLAAGLIEVWHSIVCDSATMRTLSPGGSARAELAAEAAVSSALTGSGNSAVKEGRTDDGSGPSRPESTLTPRTTRDRSSFGRAPARRWIVLGTGTEVGKTFVAEALVRLLAARGIPVAGIKPVETGLAMGDSGGQAPPGDAARLQRASFHVKHPVPHPLFGFPDPLAPSLAARRASSHIDVERVLPWLDQCQTEGGDRDPVLVIETAGGVFSPLNDSQNNLHLALALEPAEWILVAPDRLGALHDVLSTLRAMENAQRSPDWLILSAVRNPDASSGTNAAELSRRHIQPRIISLGAEQTAPLEELLQGYHSENSPPPANART